MMLSTVCLAALIAHSPVLELAFVATTDIIYGRYTWTYWKASLNHAMLRHNLLYRASLKYG
jgi:hypothetical protein